MVRKTYTPEQIINKLREAEVLLSQGNTLAVVWKKIGDLMTAWKIRRHGRRTLYEDAENGFNWYVPLS